MPKFHKKFNNREGTCRRKNKRNHSVVERKRKLRSKLRKKRKPKDPDVPNSLPFKEEILHEAEQRKQRAEDLRAIQKESRKKLQMQNRGLVDLVIEPTMEDTKFEKEKIRSSVRKKILRSSSHNFESFYKELKNVVESADVILEVLDARDPLGSRCPQVEELVISSGRKLILVLNKIDLIPKSNLETWLAYLRQELPTVAFKAFTQTQNENFSLSRVSAIKISESLQLLHRSVGSSFLMKVLGNYRRNQNIQTVIKVGVVGFPNVGKSSVINSLQCTRPCTQVGAKPGVTQTVEKISLDKNIKILDNPGVVFAKDGSSTTLALRNVVRVETMKDVIEPAEAIIQRADRTQLCLHYCIPEFSKCHELFCHIAKRIGKYKKGGELDFEAGARRLINDWNSGKIKYYTHPPKQYKPYVRITAEYVAEMEKAFEDASVEEKMEFDNAPSVLASQAMVVKSMEPPEVSIPSMEEGEKMDAENSTLQNKVTAELDAKKESSKKVQNKVDSKVLLNDMQQIKKLKNKLKKMKRKRRK